MRANACSRELFDLVPAVWKKAIRRLRYRATSDASVAWVLRVTSRRFIDPATTLPLTTSPGYSASCLVIWQRSSHRWLSMCHFPCAFARPGVPAQSPHLAMELLDQAEAHETCVPTSLLEYYSNILTPAPRFLKARRVARSRFCLILVAA